MTVADVITQLQYGELRGTGFNDDVPTLVNYMNLGIINLYGRFKLSKKTTTITILDDTTVYDMPTDIIALETVKDIVGDLVINQENDEDSVFTPSYDTLEIIGADTGTVYTAKYLAAPDSLVIDADDAVTIAQTIRLPIILLEALLLYIGYKGHASINGDIKEENNTHYIRYDATCKRIKDSGLIRNDVTSADVSLNEDYQ